jgi:Na+-transporting methylmalonyl-CoA/oxaloacetate decarboxylase gamma subunit
MNGMTVAVVSYIIAIIISFFVAGLIQIMGSILTRYAKDTPSTDEASSMDSSSENNLSDDTAVAAAIVIAKQNI